MHEFMTTAHFLVLKTCVFSFMLKFMDSIYSNISFLAHLIYKCVCVCPSVHTYRLMQR